MRPGTGQPETVNPAASTRAPSRGAPHPGPAALLPPLVSAAHLAEHLGDPGVVVLDATTFLDRQVDGGPYAVRSGRPTYLEAHLPGAGFVDLHGALSCQPAGQQFALPPPEELAAALGAAGVGDDTHVVAYAQKDPIWATRLWWLLRYLGHDAASVLDGGLPGWQATGLGVQAGECAPRARHLTARPRPDLLVTLPNMADLSAAATAGRPGAWLVNALRPSVFRGEQVTSYSRPGRIPGSVNLPWTSLVDRTTARWKSPAARTEAIAALGIPRTDRVVAYCGAGISATAAVFAWYLEGRDDVALYDGSLAEWTAHEDLPLDLG